MRVAVTGASGFIGRHLVRECRGRGQDCVALVHREGERLDVETRQFDLARPEMHEAALADIEAVVHAGAYVPRVHDDPEDARRCLEVNALGTLALVRACVRRGVRRIAILSGNVYRPSRELADESAAIGPVGRATYYLASKAYADAIVGHFVRTAPIEVVTLRPSSVYGPGQAHGMVRVFAERLLSGRAIQVDDGGYSADMVFVGDVARGVFDALSSSLVGTFNLGTGLLVGPLDVAKALARLTGASPDLIEVMHGGSPALSFAPLDSARARAVLAWQPRTLDQGLAEVVSALRGAPEVR